MNDAGSISTNLDNYLIVVRTKLREGHRVAAWRNIGTYDVTVVYGSDLIEQTAKHREQCERIW